jgi:tetratricopeptide (TPR) repeat protein
MLMWVVLLLGQSAVAGFMAPAACQALWTQTANIWERSRQSQLIRYCDLVGSSCSKLASGDRAAKAAFEVAHEAELVLPERAEALVVEGRALVAMGEVTRAVDILRTAIARDSHVLDEPATRLSWARALARTGHRDEAVEAYRELEPWVSMFHGAERSAARVEVGLALMSQGRVGLDDAVRCLRASLRDGNGDAQPVAVLVLALAFDRRGDISDAKDLLSTRTSGDPRERVQADFAKAVFSIAPPDALAASALALEISGDRDGALEQWDAAVDASASTPWLDYAKGHADRLRSTRRWHP